MSTAIQELVNAFLDVTLGMTRGKDGVTLTPTDAMTCGADGYLHFSVPLTVGEEAAWWSLGCEHAVPSQVSTNLLRPATLSGGPITGKGYAVRKGKGTMVATGEAWQDGKMLALVTVNFVHFEKRAETA